MSGGVYVYGMVRAGHPLPGEAGGVGALPATVRVVGRGPVTAVVSEAPEQLRARRRDLLAHQGLLLRLAEDGPVLPMRFGMVAPDEQTLVRQLAAGEQSYLAALELLSGRTELNVKVLPAQDTLDVLVRVDPNVRRLREAARRSPDFETKVRLGEAIAAALARRAAEAGQRAVGELKPLAHAVCMGPEVEGCVLNVSFLVERSGVERFRIAALRLARRDRDRMELRVTGPLPCYSFVTPSGTGAPRRAGAGV